jgi:hypothetical protein
VKKSSVCDYRRGFGLEIGFIDHLYTGLGTTGNYTATANLHNLPITAAPAKLFQSAVLQPFPDNGFNSGDSSASFAQALSSQIPVQNSLNSSQSQSYVTTDGQPTSLSRNKAPIWGLQPDFYYC